jgi:serine/threonine-protein phosphatase 2A regulatory subunit A
MSLANSVLQSVSCVAKELWTSTIISTCTRLLGDTDADVRLGLLTGFSSMSSTNTVEASEIAPKLVPVVVALFNDPKWRVRDMVVAQVPCLVTSLGKSADDVLEVCVKALQDRVSSIRTSGCAACAKLVQESGSAWAEAHLLPRILPLASASSFVPRLTFLQFATVLSTVASFDTKTATRALLPVFHNLVNDKVDNVRVNVAKALIALRDAGKLNRHDVEGFLDRLQHDSDADVSYAAQGGFSKKK